MTGLTTTGARVFQSRVYPLQASDLPGLRIYTRRETSEPITVHPNRQIERSVLVEVEGVATANADLDDTLDQITKEVETALAFPVSGLASLVHGIALRETEFEMEQAGERPTGRVTMTYQVDYSNVESTPDVATSKE